MHNAELMDAFGKRSGEIFVNTNLHGHKFEQLEQELKDGMLKLENAAADRIVETDKKLREQIDTVMQEIDKKLQHQHDVVVSFSAWAPTNSGCTIGLDVLMYSV